MCPFDDSNLGEACRLSPVMPDSSKVFLTCVLRKMTHETQVCHFNKLWITCRSVIFYLGEVKLKHKVDHKKSSNDFLFVFFVPILHANSGSGCNNERKRGTHAALSLFSKPDPTSPPNDVIQVAVTIYHPCHFSW